MSRENDQLSVKIGCLDTNRTHASLISTLGNHCDVWRSAVTLESNGVREQLDYVIKHHTLPCTFHEAKVLASQYQTIKSALEDIVPDALFVYTQVRDEKNVLVLARAVSPWFNIANPTYEYEAVQMLLQLPKARDQLNVFLRAAAHWQNSANAKIIDLFGLDNLVLDVNRNIRYIDSFNVFFYPDLLDLIDDDDDDLEERIDISLQRLAYLQRVLAESSAV